MKRTLVWTAALTAAAMVVSFWISAAPVRADDGETEVHVALFIKTNLYHAAAGSVTLSAAGGLAVSDDSGVEWLRMADGAPVRATFDGYRVLVAETSDAAKAQALASDAKKAGQPIAVFTRKVRGKLIYRVEAGPFDSKPPAEAARKALSGHAGITMRLGGAAMTLTGPLYAKVSAHASEAEALTAAVPLWDAGVNAIVALTPGEAGGVSHELWLGGAADEAALQQSIAAAAAAMPGLAPAPVPKGSRYAALRSDRAADNGLGAAAIRHVAVGRGGAKLTAEPILATSAVRVAERFGRSYRGAIEVSVYNGALAVVNRVDMETYVAAVVGSELDASWPAEVLKAQAVAARTYVMKQGWKYGIAQVSDTTSDQAYRGIEREFPVIMAAAQATAGERLSGLDGMLLNAFYHSNAGDRTAEPLEVWNTAIPGLVSMPSPDDAVERNKRVWYRIVLPDGRVGYIRSDLIRLTGAVNTAGFPKGAVAEAGVNVREAPYVNNETNPSIAQLGQGAGVTVIGRDMESTSYQWIRGVIDADRLQLQMASSGIAPSEVAGLGTLRELKVTKRGSASGRVIEMTANGKALPVTRPEEYRKLFHLPSTRFEVESTAEVTALGAGGRKTALPSAGSSAAWTALSAGGVKKQILTDAYLISDGSGTARVATREPGFRFHGAGFGHGLGMSQWGAFGLSELGYDYRKILLYYYKDATIIKE